MALAYNVWTEEDIKNRNVVDKGKYPFEIVGATEKKTKPGKDAVGNDKPIRDMLEVDFQFWDLNGVVRKVRDWIVMSDDMDWKLRPLAVSTGTLELYEARGLGAASLINKKGVFKLGVKEFKDSQGETRKGNYVMDYEKQNDTLAVRNDQFMDDDIPL